MLSVMSFNLFFPPHQAIATATHIEQVEKSGLYIKASKVVRVIEMVYEEMRSVEEVLKFLGK